MNRDAIQALLTQHRSDLDRFGVATLSIFGSFSRDTATADSDIDFLVTFEGKPTFDRFMGLKLFLEDLLGRRVDLVTDAALRPELRTRIEREAKRVA